MLKALIWKELRETVGVVALALLGYAFVVMSATGFGLFPFYVTYTEDLGFPFLDQKFTPIFVVVSVVFAIALGFRQTVGESIRSTWLFLLHRPANLWRVLCAKLVIGLGLYLLISAGAILLFAAWAATPGTHASPFAWWMTGSTWCAWSAVTLVYLGAFLAGFRPARWTGTRLLPLIGISLPAIYVGFCLDSWPGIGISLLLAVTAILICLIFYVARSRNYS